MAEMVSIIKHLLEGLNELTPMYMQNNKLLVDLKFTINHQLLKLC